MTPEFHPSGDLIADRRAHYADLLANSGDIAAAAELMAQTMELVPQWAPGWMQLGRYFEQLGQLDAAADAWTEVRRCDADGRLGAQLKLAAYGVMEAPSETQTGYVTALFDQYASKFDTHLVEQLHYAVPQLLSALVAEVLDGMALGQVARGLDLGCGTGLMGEAVRARVSHLTGVDLAQGMLDAAARKGAYDRLEQGELLAFLQGRTQSADLITAADVFMYCGALEPIFANAFAALRPGGFFAFSVEAHDGEDAMVLRPSLRFAHQPQAIRAGLQLAGFTVERFEKAVIRQDQGANIEGLLVVARRPQAGALAGDAMIAAEALDALRETH